MLSCIMTVRGGKEMKIGEVSKLTNVSMRSLRYSQEKLAEKVGVSRQTVWQKFLILA